MVTRVLLNNSATKRRTY